MVTSYSSSSRQPAYGSVSFRDRRWRLLPFPISVIKPEDYIDDVRIKPLWGAIEIVVVSPGTRPTGSTGMLLQRDDVMSHAIKRSRSDALRAMRFFGRSVAKNLSKSDGIQFCFYYTPVPLHDYTPIPFDKVELKLTCICDHHAVHHHLRSGDDLSDQDQQTAYGLYSRVSGQPCRYCYCVAFLGQNNDD